MDDDVELTLCELVPSNARKWPGRVSHRWKTKDGFQERTWADFEADVILLALGFEFVMVRGTVALFADNRYEWAVTDHALLYNRSVSVPRGSDTPPKEQREIFLHSESNWVIFEGVKNFQAMAAEFLPGDPKPEAVFLIDTPPAGTTYPAGWESLVITYDALRAFGLDRLPDETRPLARLVDKVRIQDPASIIYTSGTSGNPKGVVLTHRNFLHNIHALTPLLQVSPAECEMTVSILPIWHVYERTFEYCALSAGMTLFYSSARTFSEDLVREKPTLVASVPRVWESIYGKILDKVSKQSPFKQLVFRCLVATARARYRADLALQGRRPWLVAHPWAWLGRPAHALTRYFLTWPNALAQRTFAPLRALLGGRLRASFSGGGSLPLPIDVFFNSIGITLVNAYGMTESAPGSITRRLDRNVPGTIGVPLDEVQVRIVKEDGTLARVGQKGQIHVRGPNVMRCYYRNPEATAAAVDIDGWLNTGDLGAKSYSGDYVITGRAKSTIVLFGGENVEPEPIEEKLQESELIEHVVVVGQDQKGLGAILTVDEEHLKKLSEKLKIGWEEIWEHQDHTVRHHTVLTALGSEIKRLVNRENGFKPFEAITKFVVVKKKFQVGDELTQTLKVKRKVVEDKYGPLLDEVEKANRKSEKK